MRSQWDEPNVTPEKISCRNEEVSLNVRGRGGPWKSYICMSKPKYTSVMEVAICATGFPSRMPSMVYKVRL